MTTAIKGFRMFFPIFAGYTARQSRNRSRAANDANDANGHNKIFDVPLRVVGVIRGYKAVTVWLAEEPASQTWSLPPERSVGPTPL